MSDSVRGGGAVTFEGTSLTAGVSRNIQEEILQKHLDKNYRQRYSNT
jgi:hypothetical protein